MSNLNAAQGRAYVITGPTSGIGHKTALELAKHGTVVLVGRAQGKARRRSTNHREERPTRDLGPL